MQIFAMIIQFLLSLSIIVGLHELGHMLFAKLFGMRVESYTIGFPPRIVQFKWGNTVYGIGAIPLGGSVKIAGMIDESLDTQAISEKLQPWEFRAKPPWQRLLVILGGIIFNTVSGILIYVAITFLLGDTYISKDEVNKCGVFPNAVGASLGFQEGDKIISISGKDFTKFADIMEPRTLLQANGYYTVVRNGQEVRIAIPANLLEKLADARHQSGFVTPLIPFRVGEVQKQSGAQQAGLQKGDQVIEVAGQTTHYFHQLQVVLAAHAGQQVSLRYIRDGAMHHTTAQVDENGKVGFRPKLLLAYEKQNYGIGQAMAIGAERAFEVVRTNVLALSKVITGQVSASKSLSGPIGIAQIFGKRFAWIHFWSITGFLSMVLAFTNLLPIPALDGGHAVLISYEMIMGRRLSDKFLEATQKIGLAILLLLIGYAIFNDVYKLF